MGTWKLEAGGFKMTLWFDELFFAGCSGTSDDCELVGASYGGFCEISGSQNMLAGWS